MNSNIKTSMMVRFVVGCVFVVLIYCFHQASVFSAFIGAMACFVPETYQGWKISKTGGVYEPGRWLRLAYQSMITKWLMTAMIFALSFSSQVEWNYEILFIGYIVVNIAGLLTPVLLKGKRKNVS